MLSSNNCGCAEVWKSTNVLQSSAAILLMFKVGNKFIFYSIFLFAVLKWSVHSVNQTKVSIFTVRNRKGNNYRYGGLKEWYLCFFYCIALSGILCANSTQFLQQPLGFTKVGQSDSQAMVILAYTFFWLILMASFNFIHLPSYASM